MKILVIFIDMLGGEYLNLSNPNCKQTDMDRFIGYMGGTIHKNCFTPAPDTPRSSACMWSGLYPRANGCNNRLKWPRYFYDDRNGSLWETFHENQYIINAYINKSTEHVGLLPENYYINSYHGDIYNFIKNADIGDKSLNFVYLNDLHRILDNTDYSWEGYIKGNSFCKEIVEKLINSYGSIDFFDYLMIFSDHGFRLSGEKREHLLDEDRVKTFMYTRKKGDNTLVFDNELRSNLDVYPTLCDIAGIDCGNELDGKSMICGYGHDYVLAEDHNVFSSELGITIEHWACIDNTIKWHWLETTGEWTHQNNDIQGFDEQEYRDIISKKMTLFIENTKLYHVLNRIYKMKESNLESVYSDGSEVTRFTCRYSFNSINTIINKNIILYAAGKVGSDYYSQIMKIDYITIVGWVDLNWWNKSVDYGEIEGIGALFDREYDYIIVALLDEDKAKHVIDFLIQVGIVQSKILWEKPRLMVNSGCD